MNVNMMVDIAMITLIVIVFIIFCIIILRSNVKEEDAVIKYSYQSLCDKVRQHANDIMGANLMGMGLSSKELHNQEQQQMMLSKSTRKCCSGDAGAREATKSFVQTILTQELQINAQTILYAIPFDSVKQMSARQIFESLIYKLDENKDVGFSKLCEKYGWGKPDPEDGYNITERMVRNAWSDLRPRLSFADQINILVQMVYSDVFGLRCVDTLNQQKGSVEEIQIGLCGLSEKAYNYKDELLGAVSEDGIKPEYSKDSVHIMVRGNCIRLPFLSFGTDDELQRVVRNLIKNTGAGELTIKTPKKIVDTVDGRRISAAIPPVADAWVAFVRKFDAICDTDVFYWCADMASGDVVAKLLLLLASGGISIAINGDMGAGKTTIFRALLKVVNGAIRVVESESFELNVRRFLGTNSLALRVTEENPEDEVLAFIRKTSGQVMCVGELTSPAMANLTMNLSKISKQLFFSSHYISSEAMIAALTGARLSEGGYTSEKLAEME